MGRQKQPTALEVVRDMTQTAAALHLSVEAKSVFGRPASGWLRSTRQLYGLSLAEIASRRNITQQVLLRAEVAEAEERITIKNLRAIADAMGFDIIYCLVPRDRSPWDALEERTEDAVRREMLDGPQAEMVRLMIGEALDQGRSHRSLGNHS